MHSAAQTYFQTQFSTMDQGEVLLLLYDGALKFLGQAKECIERKEIAGKGIALSKAIDIINELDASLNQDVGGELAANLHQLYFICTTRLLSANLKSDIKAIDSVVEILTGLRSAYAEIVSRPEAQAASQQIQAKQKSFDNTRQPAAPSAVVPPPAAGPGGAKAHMAYTNAALQTVDSAAPHTETNKPEQAPAVPGASAATGTPPPVNRSTSLAAYGRAAQQVQP